MFFSNILFIQRSNSSFTESPLVLNPFAEGFVSSIEDFHSSDKEFHFCVNVEKFNVKQFSMLIGALTYVRAESPEDFTSEDLEKSSERLRKLLHFCNHATLIKTSDDTVVRHVDVGYRRAPGIGRLYPSAESISASSWLPKEFRGFLFDDYVDIDMVSSHFSILATFAQKHGLSCPIIEGIALKDSEIWKGCGLSQSDFKKKSVSLLNYKRSYLNYSEGFWLFYQKEIFSVRDTLITHIFHNFNLTEQDDAVCYKLKDYFGKIYLETEDMEQFEVSLTSLYCQSIESEVLVHTLDFLRENNKKEGSFVLEGVLMFDGLIVSKDQFNPEDLISLNNYLNKRTGSKFLRLAVKEMEQVPQIYDRYLKYAYLFDQKHMLVQTEKVRRFADIYDQEILDIEIPDGSDLVSLEEHERKLIYCDLNTRILKAELNFCRAITVNGLDKFVFDK